jgi:shikimate dehydrogenase
MGPSDIIGTETGLLAVLGHPVDHSLSPRIHNAALRAQAIDMVYLAFDVPPERLERAVTGLRGLGVRGVNLTIPHKESAVALMDEVEPVAARIGAINTVVNDRGRLVGHNTDRSGFIAAVHALLPTGARGLDCFVAGAGGAGRAVVAALIEDGAREVRLYNRSHDRAVSLCAQAAGWGTTTCMAISEHQLFDALRNADLVVNATAVGLIPSVKDSVIPVDILHSRQIVVDLVYREGLTLLIREAKARGATAIDGKEMLLMQAAGSYELWTGCRAPVDVMRASLDGER